MKLVDLYLLSSRERICPNCNAKLEDMDGQVVAICVLNDERKKLNLPNYTREVCTIEDWARCPFNEGK